jgi:hypothetical protein
MSQRIHYARIERYAFNNSRFFVFSCNSLQDMDRKRESGDSIAVTYDSRLDSSIICLFAQFGSFYISEKKIFSYAVV